MELFSSINRFIRHCALLSVAVPIFSVAVHTWLYLHMCGCFPLLVWYPLIPPIQKPRCYSTKQYCFDYYQQQTILFNAQEQAQCNFPDIVMLILHPLYLLAHAASNVFVIKIRLCFTCISAKKCK